MERNNSDAVRPAFDWGREGGTAESCTFCSKLLDAIHQIVEKSIRRRDHGAKESIWDQEATVADVGRVVDILSDSGCDSHKEFIRYAFFMEENTPSPQRALPGEMSPDDRVEVQWNEDNGVAMLCHIRPRVRARSDIILLDNKSDNHELSCMGRRRERDSIDLGLIKGWISTCEKLHTSTCCVPSYPTTSLAWMIDTVDGCLVPAEEITRYVAFSYVWGRAEMLMTTTETLSTLQEKGSLHANTSLNLPRVIRHAIALVPKLGERYLWVDSLCITQDDPECLARHIRHMASIYEASVFTIVAADGTHANHGILGIRGVSGPRELPPSLQLTSRLSLQPRRLTEILVTPWGGRGWTFQEHVFSKRKLVFVHDSVQWICQECQCFEDMWQDFPKGRNDASNQDLKSVGDLAVRYPRVSQVETLLLEYTTRNLTHQTDIINAIDAVFTAHHRAFPHGFFWGLPVDFFDMALLWMSSGDKSNTRRRQAYPNPLMQFQFPSWTWAGWAGRLMGGQWRSATYIKDPSETLWGAVRKCLTIPMLVWRHRSHRGSPELPIPGQNSAHEYRLQFMGKKDGLPPGWRYERETFGPDTQRDTMNYKLLGCDPSLMTPYYYSHEAAPGVKFCHPVPTSTDPPSDVKATTDGPLLCAKTARGRLWAMPAKLHPDCLKEPCSYSIDGEPRVYIHLFSNKDSVDLVLTDEKGDLVGDLFINDPEDRDLVRQYKSQPGEAGFPCELVAISKGNDFVQPMEREKETYTFYNVLWVKWEDGIAYRRGLGRVKREIWENMDLQDVDLILG